MKTLKAFLLLLLTELVITIIGCCEEHHLYNISSFQIVNLDNSQQYPVESTGNEIAARAFGLRAKIENEYFVLNPDNQFGSSAMATSCTEYFNLKNTLVALDIITLSEFDSLHNQNSDITAYFVSRNAGATNENYITVPSLISSINSTEIEYQANRSYDFYLLHEPAADSVFQFVINFYFKDGSILSDTSQQIILR